LLVCVLVAVLAGLVAPSFTASMSHSRLDAAARAVVAFARAARARASADGKAYFLIVDGTARQARLARQRDPLAAPEAEADAENEGDAWADGAPWARTYDFPDDVNVGFASTTYQDVQTSTITAPGSSNAPASMQGTTPPNVQVAVDSGKPVRVAFNPEGTADDATIDLTGPEDARVRIVIDSPSGRSRILTADELADALAAQNAAGSTSSSTVAPTVIGTVAPLPVAPGGR
jgi:Tfp pilus assembly protein FimT